MLFLCLKIILPGFQIVKQFHALTVLRSLVLLIGDTIADSVVLFFVKTALKKPLLILVTQKIKKSDFATSVMK